MSARVTFLLFSFLFSSISAFFDLYYLDAPAEKQKFCTVPGKFVIKSMKTGAFLVGGDVGDVISAQNEDMLTGNQFWTVEGGSGIFVIRDSKTSAILDVEGGCAEGMNNRNVITYQKTVTSNNRFYINPLDHTIGVQCGADLRVKVNETGSLIVSNIYDPENSDEDIYFSIERTS